MQLPCQPFERCTRRHPAGTRRAHRSGSGALSSCRQTRTDPADLSTSCHWLASSTPSSQAQLLCPWLRVSTTRLPGSLTTQLRKCCRTCSEWLLWRPRRSTPQPPICMFQPPGPNRHKPGERTSRPFAPAPSPPHCSQCEFPTACKSGKESGKRPACHRTPNTLCSTAAEAFLFPGATAPQLCLPSPSRHDTRRAFSSHSASSPPCSSRQTSHCS
mmetsp:Transcript_128843/g.411946  ORF Transcript_128843/g.411946 Transcript_128843/m.411946 type:complete len:215 (-) Transcript_128843:718-1362(-)